MRCFPGPWLEPTVIFSSAASQCAAAFLAPPEDARCVGGGSLVKGKNTSPRQEPGCHVSPDTASIGGQGRVPRRVKVRGTGHSCRGARGFGRHSPGPNGVSGQAGHLAPGTPWVKLRRGTPGQCSWREPSEPITGLPWGWQALGTSWHSAGELSLLSAARSPALGVRRSGLGQLEWHIKVVLAARVWVATGSAGASGRAGLRPGHTFPSPLLLLK